MQQTRWFDDTVTWMSETTGLDRDFLNRLTVLEANHLLCVMKFNPNHDARGRFTFGEGAQAALTVPRPGGRTTAELWGEPAPGVKEPEKPTEESPAWRPGDGPFMPDKPIGERIALARHLDEKLKVFTGHEGTVADHRHAIEQRSAELMSLDSRIRELTNSAAHPNQIKELTSSISNSIEMREEIDKHHEAIRSIQEESLRLSKGEYVSWKHTMASEGPLAVDSATKANAEQALKWLAPKIAREREIGAQATALAADPT